MAALVSTIIPVFNRPVLLGQAVESVLAQSYRPIEIIIVNDGSTDETRAAAEALATAHREVRVLHRPQRGPGAAREAGRLETRGQFIQYLDSDDLLEPRKFEIQIAGLTARPECGASYGWTRLRDSDGKADPRPFKRTGERVEAMFPAFLQSRWWDTSTPLFRRSVVDAAGPWLSLRVEEDWEYDARIASLGTKLHYCDTWVSETRQIDPHRTSLRRGREVMEDRARAHALIYAHARRAGVGNDVPEMIHFARELFLLSRQCGAHGLGEESKMLFELSREASGARAGNVQFTGYQVLARIVGWPLAGKMSAVLDRFRW